MDEETKKTYETPEITDLGNVSDLTNFDLSIRV
jgi:hypothetical protein